jgi:hypothetical protein
MWFYPDGRRLLELSTKCAPEQTMQVATETRLFLADHHIELTGAQETKTKSALQYFAKEVRELTAPAAGVAEDGAAPDATDGAAPDATDGAAPDASDETAAGVSPSADVDQIPVEVAAVMDGEAGTPGAEADADPE